MREGKRKDENEGCEDVTQTLLHTDALEQIFFFFHKQTPLHKHFYTQKFLHTDAFTTDTFYAQKGLHTQTLLHTEAFKFRPEAYQW